MSSGAKVEDKAKDIFSEMKVVKNDAVAEERIRLVTFHVDGDIKMEKMYRNKDIKEDDDAFMILRRVMHKEQCRFILYDCHYETKESSRKEELVFVLWAPDTAPIKDKMLYASSKSAIGKVFNGVKHTLQLNDTADHEPQAFADYIGKNITKLETISLGGQGVKG